LIKLDDYSDTVLDKFSEQPEAGRVHIIVECCAIGESFLVSDIAVTYAVVLVPAVGHLSEPIEELADRDVSTS
jgi:hypothetical protein